ncbi:DUF1513 domain-containing protein [Prosthecomicrobium hirschii]|uniref:DUF1513 domain-containing protein n=1 Tax=Prosthecodimorpha hirschii TaxID=665126 RepID=UPI00221EF978|nr:DUF1513 domain-containing protein [Prosthecomicrobium hirschii]MCW1839963.1 DUF1513 domain-containing protein [Prosthecomicrobium hirschii]
MPIDRRSLILSLGAAIGASLLPRGAGAVGAPPRLFAGCLFDADGGGRLALFDPDGRQLVASDLPARGHDVAVSPDGRLVVAFARRPGTWAAVIERASGRVLTTILAAPERHFYGHGVFSPDGRLLMATENDTRGGDGLVGLYDVADGFRRLGEVPSCGVGPHDMALMPGGELVAVANGGIRTHPETGRDMLNLDAMRPNLALLRRDGGLADAFELPEAFRLSSLRHIAVAPDGTVGFGCQYVGDPEAAPELIGVLTRSGRLELLPVPEDANMLFENYIGSVAFDASGTILAAASPKGGAVGYWDVPGRRFLGMSRLTDACGLAAAPASGLFMLSGGASGLRLARAETGDLARLGGSDAGRWMWDNHLLTL